jgi:predicted nucleotidyltransferase
MQMEKVWTLDAVKADWARVKCEVAYVRTIVAAHLLMKALRRQGEQKFNPGQPRIPAGQTGGGQWTDGGDSADSVHLANARRATSRVIVGGRTYTVTSSQETDLIFASENAAQAMVRVRQLDPEWRPATGPSITDPNSADGAIRAYRDLAQEANGRAIVLERGGVPLGFNSRHEFQAFGSEARNSLMFAGHADAEPYLTGSAVTGYKYTTGQLFDVGRRSDYDLAIVSPRLIQMARERGIELRSRGARTGQIEETELKLLGLENTVRTLQEYSGRDVHIMIYRSTEDLAPRGPNIPVR